MNDPGEFYERRYRLAKASRGRVRVLEEWLEKNAGAPQLIVEVVSEELKSEKKRLELLEYVGD